MNRIESVLKSLDSSYHAESIGSVQEIGFYALIHGRKYHFVIQETDQGFLNYTVYKDKELALEHWYEVEMKYNLYYMSVCEECIKIDHTRNCSNCEYQIGMELLNY